MFDPTLEGLDGPALYNEDAMQKWLRAQPHRHVRIECPFDGTVAAVLYEGQVHKRDGLTLMRDVPVLYAWARTQHEAISALATRGSQMGWW